MIKIATDSGSIMWAKAEIVKANDNFTYRGPCELPVHEMNPFGDRGATIGVYCIAKTHQGDYLVDIMGADEIAKIRKAAKQDYVWNAWPDEMTKKAMIKRASKQWPKTDRNDRLEKAVAFLNESEGSEDIKLHEKIINPNQDQHPAIAITQKPAISNAGLNTAIAKICAGEDLTIQRVMDNRALNEDQLAAVKKWQEGAEWVDLTVEAAQ